MTTDSSAINDMLDTGLLQALGSGSINNFLGRGGLGVLFFAGGDKQRSDAHDVAVALREILRDYAGQVHAGHLHAGLVAQSDAEALQPQFRVLVAPSLVLVHGGEVLEVIPRVRDWADYARAFQRYLGNPDGATLEAQS